MIFRMHYNQMDRNNYDMMNMAQNMWIIMIIGLMVFLIFLIILIYFLTRQTSSIEPKSPINKQFKKSPNIDEIESDNQLKGNYCPNCGTQLTNTETIYCPSCGSSLK